MAIKNLCVECRKKVRKGFFRCDECTEASKANFDPKKRSMPTMNHSTFKNGGHGAAGLK